jgi:nucleotide-binding universal stress UspA family protein
MNTMINFQRILCPVDFSEESKEALQYAAAIAKSYEAKLFICNCQESLSTTDSVYGTLKKENLKKVIEDSVNLYTGPIDISSIDWDVSIIEDSNAAEAITKEASEQHVDLIVMRSRRRPHRAALLGSMAESVCRIAPCPVLVTHADERDLIDSATGNIALNKILVACDFSDESELALRYALSLAQEYQAELHLLHVISPFIMTEPEVAWYPVSTEGAYHKAARTLQRAIPSETYLWCKVKHMVSTGKPYREILSYSEKNNIDLICMGSRGAGFGMQSLFGSNVDRVLRQASCPILVTRTLRPASIMSLDK